MTTPNNPIVWVKDFLGDVIGLQIWPSWSYRNSAFECVGIVISGPDEWRGHNSIPLPITDIGEPCVYLTGFDEGVWWFLCPCGVETCLDSSEDPNESVCRGSKSKPGGCGKLLTWTDQEIEQC